MSNSLFRHSFKHDSSIDIIAINLCQNQSSTTLIDEIEEKINVIVPFLVVTGIIGNLLSIITFSKKKLRSLSCGCYLLLVAIADTFALIIISRPYFFKIFNNVHHLESSILCGFHLFFTKIFDELSPWLLVFLACNRLMLTKLPRKNYRCFRTGRTALVSSLLLFIFFILLNLHLLFGIGIGYSESLPCKKVCGPLLSNEYYLFFYKNISPIIDLLFTLILPFCVIFIANIFIISNVKNIKRRVLRHRKHKRVSRNFRLSIVLLTHLIIFLLLCAPVLIVEIIYRFTRSPTLFILSNKYERILSIAWLVANKLFYLNYSLSFYFYVLASSYFRHQFYNVIQNASFNYFYFKRRVRRRLEGKDNEKYEDSIFSLSHRRNTNRNLIIIKTNSTTQTTELFTIKSCYFDELSS
ncbi:unnamed protein product [Didymodactylos carnosus]|uniref:G-protein coupled receptors family 1 profile domain-containing protein n=1 Tax=Didymodactylos carnosus TaxID=1234261 RepID=A0A814YDW9_9BILA|nr:unnamed protein product [Didymodactylos carnosus]CAF3991030.1 unnamed protein product [Didymodactylos carnosus]